MAVYPGGYKGRRATRSRTILYIVAVVVVGVVAVAGYLWLRQRGADASAEAAGERVAGSAAEPNTTVRKCRSRL